MTLIEKNELFLVSFDTVSRISYRGMKDDIEAYVKESLQPDEKLVRANVEGGIVTLVFAKKTDRELELERDSDFLSMLRGQGLDNWEGYSLACEEFAEKYPEEDE